MWTALLVTFSASLVTLKSMSSLVEHKKPGNPGNTKILYQNFLLSNAEQLPYLLEFLLAQLHLIKAQVTIEIVFIQQQIEFVLHIPNTIKIPPEVQSLLIPVNALWSDTYSPEFIVDDTESISSSLLAHQIILKAKTTNIVYITTRGIKKTPDQYSVSGIDSFKWSQFVNKMSDPEPDIITHDRIYSIIQDKISAY